MAKAFTSTIESISGHVPTALDLRFDRDTWQKIGDAVRDTVIKNVAEQNQADGTRIKKNAQSTLAKKHRLGRGSRSLVDNPATHRFFRRSSFAVLADEHGVTVYPKDREVSRDVQGKGYTGWLGLSKAGWNQVRKIVTEFVQGLSKGTRKKRR